MEIKMNVTVYNLDLPLGKRLKAVHDMGLKKGDEATITFNDEEIRDNNTGLLCCAWRLGSRLQTAAQQGDGHLR